MKDLIIDLSVDDENILYNLLNKDDMFEFILYINNNFDNIEIKELNYKNDIKYSGFFLTEKSVEEHINMNKHNYKKVYVRI